jgi:pSer/pThr/pTyr-binding forkhead associated (FHA) protein
VATHGGEGAAKPGASAKTVVCGRCNGLSEAGGGFCRFCGAPLADGSPGASAGTNGTGTTTLVTPTAPPGSGPVQALVLSIGQDGTASATFELRERLDIGRLEGDVVIGWDPYLSPRHLRLEARPDGSVVARDLGTVNGTYVRVRAEHDKARAGDAGDNGVSLQDQDLILLGQQVIRFEVVKDAEAGFGPATQHGTALFGTPAGPVYARLCQRTVEGVTRDVFHVRKDEVVLGRELGDVVFTDDAFLSRRHAIVRRDPASGTFTLLDASSSNGTFVRVRGEVALHGGDELRIGQQLFRIEPPPAAAGKAS